MASSFAKEAATALRLIKARGREAVFTRTTGGSYNPVTQQTVGATVTTLRIFAVGIAPGKSAEYKIGALTKRNLIELLCAPALGSPPAEGDSVLWGSYAWKVIWVDVLNPDGEGAVFAKAYAER
jgi:hypothetical protein